MTVSKTLAERGSRYGAFADHAKIAQGIQDTMRAAPKWSDLDQDMKQALSVIADKIARILNGDPFYVDNWHDIQGYAKLIEDRLDMVETKPTTTLYELKTDKIRQGDIEEALRKWNEKNRNPLRRATGGYAVAPQGITTVVGADNPGAYILNKD